MTTHEQLRDSRGGLVQAWLCNPCGSVYINERTAEDCHGPRLCACGGHRSQRYYDKCDECRRIEEASKDAARLAEAEEVIGYEGYVFAGLSVGPKDGFFESVSDLVDWWDGHRWDEDPPPPLPEFVYACDEGSPPQFIDADGEAENCFADSFEEAIEHLDPDVMQDFRVACARFNENIKHILSYSPDYKRKVRVRA